MRDRRAPISQNITSHLPIYPHPKPLTVDRRRGHPAGSVRVNISTSHEPSASEQNTGYTTRGRGRRRRRGRGRGRVGGRRREHELARRCSS